MSNPAPIVEDPNERLKKYITEPDLPEIHDPKPYYTPGKVDLYELFHVPECPASTTIGPVRDTAGNVIDYVEIPLEGIFSFIFNTKT